MNKSESLSTILDRAYHTFAYGATGSGKSDYAVLPYLETLIANGESFLAAETHPKCAEELVELLNRSGYKTYIFDLQNPNFSSAWNPFSLAIQQYKKGDISGCINELIYIGESIFKCDKEDDPFWNNSAMNLFVGLALCLLYLNVPDDHINFESIYSMLIDGEQRFGASTYLEVFIEDSVIKDFPIAYNFVNMSYKAASDTKASIHSVFKERIMQITRGSFYDPILCNNDFSINDICSNRIAIILTSIEYYKGSSFANFIIRSFFRQIAYLHSIDQREGKSITNTFHFVIDDFQLLDLSTDFDMFISEAKNSRIRLFYAFSSFNILEKKYGKNSVNAMISNCGNKLFFAGDEINYIRDFRFFSGKESESRNYSILEQQMKLKIGDAHMLAIISGQEDQIVKLAKYTKTSKNDRLREYRHGNDIVKYDLKKIAKEKREESMHQVFGGNQSSNRDIFNTFDSDNDPFIQNIRRRRANPINTIGDVEKEISRLLNPENDADEFENGFSEDDDKFE